MSECKNCALLSERAAQDTQLMRKLADVLASLRKEAQPFMPGDSMGKHPYGTPGHEMQGVLIEFMNRSREMLAWISDVSRQDYKVSPDNIAHEFAGPEATGVHPKGARTESSGGAQNALQPVASRTAQDSCDSCSRKPGYPHHYFCPKWSSEKTTQESALLECRDCGNRYVELLDFKEHTKHCPVSTTSNEGESK